MTSSLRQKSKGYEAQDFDNHFAVDAAFIRMSFAQQMVNLIIGRKYFLIGSGIVFNGRGDGAELHIYSKYMS